MNESLECVRLASSEAEYRKQGLLQRCYLILIKPIMLIENSKK